jgi:putative PIN family toxin of toxin-antitoxin system
MLVVLDTNVMVSALLSPFGKPAAVVGLLLEEKATICYDSRIIAEYLDVLRRPKFGFPSKEVEDIIDFIKVSGTLCTAYSDLVKSTHRADLPFAQACLAAGAEYLITGNTQHFPKNIGQASVVTPSKFLERFYSGKP